MKGKKTPIEIKAVILEKKINNPDASSRDIAGEIGGIDNTTVNDILKDNLPQLPTESKLVADLITRNDNLQSAADSLIAEMIASKDDSITIAQLTTLRESTFKQNQLIQGKTTENNKVTIEWTV